MRRRLGVDLRESAVREHCGVSLAGSVTVVTEPQAQLQIQVPDDIQGGVYANMAVVWHTPYDFTIDFAATAPPVAGPDGEAVVPARVVARVKFPPSQIFQLLQAINANMTNYEAAYGPITTPGSAAAPPPDGDND